ncbi:MAG: hypothetical protein CSB48_01160 [Proteobacteria bacterium]|nr:MAG: hypothetical protein CSB48_01160 [Pseudomonadota bacterium]
MTKPDHTLWHSPVITAWLAILAVFCQSAFAEQKEVFDGFEVHYNAFSSTFLEPDVAKRYGIARSKAVGVVNITVLKTAEGSKPVPVAAQIEGLLNNSVQQQRRLPFRRITEGRAIYYIAEFQFVQSELLTFAITVYPEGGTQPLKLRFSQNFYSD